MIASVFAHELLVAPLLTASALAQSPPMEFVKIALGELIMGCSPSESPYMPGGTYALCQPTAQPAHRVRITKPFEMGKYEVTHAQWEAVMGSNPSFFKGADRPVEQVSWEEAGVCAPASLPSDQPGRLDPLFGHRNTDIASDRRTERSADFAVQERDCGRSLGEKCF
jgi:formylglycine-generating enzyme required for sulfatase activity